MNCEVASQQSTRWRKDVGRVGRRVLIRTFADKKIVVGFFML